MSHHEIWEYYQGLSEVHARVLQNLTVCITVLLARYFSEHLASPLCSILQSPDCFRQQNCCMHPQSNVQ